MGDLPAPKRSFDAKSDDYHTVLPDPGVVNFTLTGLSLDLGQCQLEIGVARMELLRDHLAAWCSGPAEAVKYLPTLRISTPCRSNNGNIAYAPCR